MDSSEKTIAIDKRISAKVRVYAVKSVVHSLAFKVAHMRNQPCEIGFPYLYRNIF